MRKIIPIILFHLISNGLFSQECNTYPAFLDDLEFNPYSTAFSTNEIDKVGIVAYELENRHDLQSRKLKYFQEATWTRAGYMGMIAFDENGNIFTAPLPKVNTLNNPPEDQNTIYIIDTNTGKMEPFFKLPVAHIPNTQNPFGILGIFYDCNDKSLYISTVSGSTREEERGKIYQLNTRNKELSQVLSGIDILGLGVINIGSEKLLIYGRARNSTIWTVRLSGDTAGMAREQKMIINLNGLGVRGDDKGRKFRYKDGILEIHAVPFMYNLVAPHRRQETVYSFRYEAQRKKWTLTSIY